MKRRIKKKGECAHYYYGDSFLVTDDPYPMYNNEEYCKLGKFDLTWGRKDQELPCERCKKFKLSRVKQRMDRQDYKEYRKMCWYAKRYEKTHPQEAITPQTLDFSNFFDMFE